MKLRHDRYNKHTDQNKSFDKPRNYRKTLSWKWVEGQLQQAKYHLQVYGRYYIKPI